MRIAITGGDGPVGRALQKVLTARAADFRCLVSSEPPLELARLGEYVVGSETDPEAVDELLDGAGALIHLGRTGVPAADEFCQDELLGQSTLIPVARERLIEIHFLSSSQVFTPPPDPRVQAFGEEDPIEPASPLGVAKAAWEQTLRIWGERKGLRFVIYRVPTVVPEFLGYSSVFARYLRTGYREGVIAPRAYEGDRWGTCYVHAEDVAAVLADTIGREDVMGETFHLAAEQWISEHELAEMSYRVLRDFMIPSKWNPAPSQAMDELTGDVCLDTSKARVMLRIEIANSVARLATKLRFWIDDFGSTARLPIAT